MNQERRDIIIGIALFAASTIILLSLLTFDRGDLALFSYPPNVVTNNYIGIFGAYFAATLVFLIGFMPSFIVPALLYAWSIAKFLSKPQERLYIRLLGILCFFVSLSSLFALIGSAEASRFANGGVMGFFFSSVLLKYCGAIGTLLILMTILALSSLIATEFAIIPALINAVKASMERLNKDKSERPARELKVNVKPVKTELPRPPVAPKISIKTVDRPAKVSAPPAEKQKAPTFSKPKAVGTYNLPATDLLDLPPPIEEIQLTDDLEKSCKILEETLDDFGIQVKVTNCDRGPVVTVYELEPAPGVKVNRITNLSDDIALAMKAASVRIIAPIPGKARVGVEIPNSSSTMVFLREIIEASEFKSSKSLLTMCLGKDVSGIPVVSDLAEMPHLLIAGTTGSGKTVCVNALIMSMLFNASPDQLKFIMVDPKMVELATFNDLPHLLCPVLTDPKKVSGALHWVVNEMESRYKLLAKIGARNIDLYNEKVKDLKSEECQPLPYIVVMIDELADLMLIAAQDVENAITRLAQLSRAVGIHIVLATQRPSVDVVTGVIKANFPARISFNVASKVDSRTVLDANGADKLLGRGDLLFLKPGAAKLIRAQGALVSDKEIERVVTFIKAQRQPEFAQDLMDILEKKSGTIARVSKEDDMYDDAVHMVLETKQASVSMLQRRLGLGYTRAARLIDTMEDRGIVGPYRGSKPREILTDSVDVAGKDG